MGNGFEGTGVKEGEGVGLFLGAGNLSSREGTFVGAVKIFRVTSGGTVGFKVGSIFRFLLGFG